MSTIKEEFEEFNKKLDASRKMGRNTMYRLIILSASIVGFSVSLFSIPTLQSNIDFSTLRYSWYFFLGVIILGFFILMFEGRLQYGTTWKGFQSGEYPNKYDYSLKEKLLALLIVVISIFYPANLFFNKIYQNKAEKLFKERVNGLVVHELATIGHYLLFLENIIFIMFICGLILLIISVG